MSLNGELIASNNALKDRSHSEILTLMISDLIADSQIDKSDLSGIVLGIGPGSYTGLRVGSAVAKGLCYSLDIPLIIINTLTALASPYRDESPDTLLLPMLIARKEEVYLQALDGTMSISIPVMPTLIDDALVESLALDLKHKIVICGNANHLIREYINNPNIKYIDKTPSAEDLASISYQYYLDKIFADIAYFDLDYIKSPHITKSKKKGLIHRSVKK